jgi:hypothetical protein
MSKEFVIYCDESIDKGSKFSNFYGGILIRSDDVDEIRHALAATKSDLWFKGEVKWSKITESYADRYIKLIDRFFDFVSRDMIKVRIMFTQNINIPIGLTKEQLENQYFLLYYQFIKHAFGLRYSNDTHRPIHIRLFLDRLPDTEEKSQRFRSYIRNLSRNPRFRDAQIRFREEDITDVHSHEHDVLQCLDIVLGSMQFRLNNKHKDKPKGQRRRGKRTVAKEKVYKHILGRIQQIYPKFNIGISTGMGGDMSNLWRHRYRHWLFVPNERETQR